MSDHDGEPAVARDIPEAICDYLVTESYHSAG
jgi:hypothetical protein